MSNIGNAVKKASIEWGSKARKHSSEKSRVKREEKRIMLEGLKYDFVWLDENISEGENG